jgi:hypothetical protein
MWDSSVLALHSGQMAPKDFYPIFLSWLDDPDCSLDIEQSEDEEARVYFEKLEKSTNRVITKNQRNFWISQRRELSEDIMQEYPGTAEEAFMASKDGTYFSRAFNEHCVRGGRVKSGLYDKNLPVEVFFDLGVEDYCVMAFTQYYRGEWRIIHEYHNDGYGLSHYLDYIRFSEYRDNIYALKFPFDINVREQGNSHKTGRAKSRKDSVLDYKREFHQTWHVDTIPKGGLLDGIEQVRRMITNMSIDVSCTYIINCMNRYTKEWDDNLKVWKKTPVHNEWSHGADCLRQIATARGYSVSNSSKDHVPTGGDI